jgi:ribonuclease HI
VTSGAILTWEKPTVGWFKSNTDGAFYERQWNGATGAVLRDDQGRFGRGVAKWYDHCLDALAMEAMACLDGLNLAFQLWVQRLWLETDCQEVIKLWMARGRLGSLVCFSKILNSRLLLDHVTK